MKMLAMIVLITAHLAAGPFPAAADEAPTRHLIYLHGRIVQVRQDPRPEHPQFGFYEMEAILDAFRERGFTVHAGIRPPEITVDEAADHVVALVDSLTAAGVPADRVTVLGASMGAGIALVASARLGDADLNFAVLGTCLSLSIPRAPEQEGRPLTGRILAVREASDRVTEKCPALTADAWSVDHGEFAEILLETGLDHGFLYRPLPEWVGPVAAWAMRDDRLVEQGD